MASVGLNGRRSSHKRVSQEISRRDRASPIAHLRQYKGSGRPPDTCGVLTDSSARSTPAVQRSGLDREFKRVTNRKPTVLVHCNVKRPIRPAISLPFVQILTFRFAARIWPASATFCRPTDFGPRGGIPTRERVESPAQGGSVTNNRRPGDGMSIALCPVIARAALRFLS